LISPPAPLGGVSRLATRLFLLVFISLPVATVLGPVLAVVSAASCTGNHA
jgi:hypothetical protein